MSFTFDMNGRLNRQSKANIEFSNTIAKAKPYVNFFNGCLVVASHPLVIIPTNITQNSRVYVTRCCQLLNHVQEHYNVHSFCLCIIDGERFNMIRKWIGLYWLRWVERMGKEIQVSVHDVFRISKKFYASSIFDLYDCWNEIYPFIARQVIHNRISYLRKILHSVFSINTLFGGIGLRIYKNTDIDDIFSNCRKSLKCWSVLPILSSWNLIATVFNFAIVFSAIRHYGLKFITIWWQIVYLNKNMNNIFTWLWSKEW